MQLKPITMLAVLLLVVASLLVSGCTSNTPPATPTATPTAQATASTGAGADKLAGLITDLYKSKNYTVNTPFNMTKSGDKITYTGVITDGSKVLKPYKHNITIVLTPNRTSARTLYQAAIDNQTAQGYKANVISNDTFVYWTGYLGTSSSSTNAPRAFDMLAQPESTGSLRLPDSDGNANLFLSGANTDYFEVITDLATVAG
jgi:arabinogalactan endo-1,4-beta-galactosidase